ncbi:cytochrome ubiquinol oxidase subunit I [Actinocorallia longicatena]|uniref:Cytochrome ubiquinol oxidase subunit I n=1 Tax=Actinocorallia longicatena TaxID=111803 RepID=A0ABP6QDX5_9ACTN
MTVLGLTAQRLLAEAPTTADFVAARQQMAFTLGFHIVLASIGIGLPALTVLAEWRGRRTGDPAYRELARTWMKAAGVLFAVGAVSGTVLSFEMGTLWPGFMETYGEVFGAAFAMEGIAFFIEAIFMGIYLYGWDRLPPRVHLLTGIPVVVSGLLSAFFVVCVNSWMNQPQGFKLVDGHVEDVQPLRAMFNPATPPQAAHLIVASLMVCGFLVASVYAVPLLKGSRERYHRLGFAIPFTMAAVLTPVQLLIGDWASRFVAERQPLKFAAMEGIDRTQAGVPFKAGPFSIPDGLSLMLKFDRDSVLQGLDAWPEADRPPHEVVRTAFETMIVCGLFLLLLSLVWFWLNRSVLRRGHRPEAEPGALQRWLWRGALVSGIAAVVAMEAGWTVTEVAST